jgi:hypothetical protein
MRRHAFLAGLALLPVSFSLSALLSPLRAQQPDHPPFMPTRDVAVIYDVQPEGAPAPQRITASFGGDGRLMRIDSPDGQGETILDRDRKLMTVVMNSARVFMDVPEREAPPSPFLLDASMRFARVGTDTVAGLDCIRWAIAAASGSATACVTHDGVLLSEEGVDSQGARGRLVAQRVTYGPLPATVFQPPADYTRVAHPEGPPPTLRDGDGGLSGAPVTGPMPPAATQ